MAFFISIKDWFFSFFINQSHAKKNVTDLTHSGEPVMTTPILPQIFEQTPSTSYPSFSLTTVCCVSSQNQAILQSESRQPDEAAKAVVKPILQQQPVSLQNNQGFCYVNSVVQMVCNPFFCEALKLTNSQSAHLILQIQKQYNSVTHLNQPYDMVKHLQNIGFQHFKDYGCVFEFMHALVSADLGINLNNMEGIIEDNSLAESLYTANHPLICKITTKMNFDESIIEFQQYRFTIFSLELEGTEQQDIGSLLETYFSCKDLDFARDNSGDATVDPSKFVDKLPPMMWLNTRRSTTGNGLTKSLLSSQVTFKISKKWISDEDSQESTKYRIAAFICHKKDSNDRGRAHYVCYKSIEERWFLCDDDKVKEVTTDAQFKQDFQQHAVMLFAVKQGE